VYDAYLEYTLETEPPAIYHRWSAITSISALLGRSLYIRHGHFRIFPNLYTMLLGDTGSRKSSAIKMVKQLLEASGYESFAAEKTSKEKFLLDLEGLQVDGEEALSGSAARKAANYDSLTERNLWGEENYEFAPPREVFICADEFNDFSGSGNMEFYTTLGNFWDWDNPKIPYRSRVKNSRSISIFQPTVSILSGNTPENFARAFPPEIMGQGFLSRLLLIHGKRREKSIAFPENPPQDETDKMVEHFRRVLGRGREGLFEIDGEAKELLTLIYDKWTDLPDIRFKSYSNRRFTQLLKLCLITSIAMWKDEVDLEAVLYSNTILTAAENVMPAGLGEFGKARNSDVTHKVMQFLQGARKPINYKEIWNVVRNDLDKPAALQDLLQGLAAAEKVQHVPGGTGGWLPRVALVSDPEFVDFTLLSEEER